MKNFLKINPFGNLRINAEQSRSINKEKIILLLIILLGAFFRFYNLNWDQGSHLHPDERAIIMFALPLHFPSSVSEFLSPQSPLNPHFFAYGNFPLYLLKGAAATLSIFDKSFDSYDRINLLGRAISAVVDFGTIILLYFIGKKLFNKIVGTLAAFFYSTSVFPIQASHFYAVDVVLTFFILLTLYQLLQFYEKPNLKNSILVGVFFGASLATKISAIPLLSAITAAIAIDFLLLIAKQPHKPRIWFPHVPRFLKRFIIDGVVILASTAIIFSILQPYAIIDFNTFLRQNMEQSQMTRDAFTFPYTLQYVGKIPYLYELKNIFFWGQGPFLALLSFLGILYSSIIVIKKRNDVKKSQELILVIFFWAYFLIIGRFAIGFMRYMLPVYPLLCIFAASFFLKLLSLLPKNYRVLFSIFYFLFSIAWPLSFIKIYTRSNTRVLASEWISTNVKPFSRLAIEHWDDRLPLFGQQNYNFITLPLYDPDVHFKWRLINEDLSKADYIIIASNRLYVPLQKLTDCQSLSQNYCYPLTAEYYKKLFNGSLGFKKVAEFSSYPKLEIPALPVLEGSLPNGRNWKLEINDLSADESFTVYDHPKIIIFKRE